VYKKTKILLLLIVISYLLFVNVPSVQAIAPIVPPCARAAAAQTTPGLDCIVFTIINIAKLILGISGSVALALFIYGGFLMLVSRGNETIVTKGKSVLSGALIGLIIIFGAYTGVFFLIKTLTQSSPEAAGLLECLVIKTGETKPPTATCGPEGQGRCQAGICTVPTRPPLPAGTGCCIIQTSASIFNCQGEMSQEDCSAIPGSAGIAADYCDNIRIAGGCQ
jgi:hypothetical protein